MAKHQRYRSNRMKKREYLKYFLEHVTPYYAHQKHLTGEGLIENVRYFKVHTEMKVFKKAHIYVNGWSKRESIVSLRIPVGAIVHHSLTNHGEMDMRKCRANMAIVEQVYDLTGHKIVKEAVSNWLSSFKYVTGKTVRPKHERFSMHGGVCAAGVHFFLQVNDALDYS